MMKLDYQDQYRVEQTDFILEAVILPALWVYQVELWFWSLVNSSVTVMSVAVTLTVTLSHTSSNSVYVNSSCCGWYKLFSEGCSSLIAALGLYKSENG